MDDPTTNPLEAREILVPCSVIAGPPIESGVPSTRTAVLASGVNVSPPAVSALLSSTSLLPAVANAMVDVPMISDPAALREYSVPLIETPGDPGRIVE